MLFTFFSYISSSAPSISLESSQISISWHINNNLNVLALNLSLLSSNSATTHVLVHLERGKSIFLWIAILSPMFWEGKTSHIHADDNDTCEHRMANIYTRKTYISHVNFISFSFFCEYRVRESSIFRVWNNRIRQRHDRHDGDKNILSVLSFLTTSKKNFSIDKMERHNQNKRKE